MFCDLNGSWTSASGGMRIDITKATDGSVKASLAERTPKKRLVEGFLGDASWKITATMPFKNSGLIILNAVHEEDRHAATFIGNIFLLLHHHNIYYEVAISLSTNSFRTAFSQLFLVMLE